MVFDTCRHVSNTTRTVSWGSAGGCGRRWRAALSGRPASGAAARRRAATRERRSFVDRRRADGAAGARCSLHEDGLARGQIRHSSWFGHADRGSRCRSDGDGVALGVLYGDGVAVDLRDLADSRATGTTRPRGTVRARRTVGAGRAAAGRLGSCL